MPAIVAKNIEASASCAVWPKYSICTLVSDSNLYRQMLESFVEAGFTADIAEYLYIENSAANIVDAYTGFINTLFSIALISGSIFYCKTHRKGF
jgi:hypothetical protein